MYGLMSARMHGTRFWLLLLCCCFALSLFQAPEWRTGGVTRGRGERRQHIMQLPRVLASRRLTCAGGGVGEEFAPSGGSLLLQNL